MKIGQQQKVILIVVLQLALIAFAVSQEQGRQEDKQSFMETTSSMLRNTMQTIKDMRAITQEDVTQVVREVQTTPTNSPTTQTESNVVFGPFTSFLALILLLIC